MGYKLAGYTVVGNCELDASMNNMYKANFHPVYSYEMDIRDFSKANTFPPELLSLDILDGSPPCSVFSSVGQREKGWNKEKQFREGQKKQKLDDLFFYFIETARKLQPKVVVAENVPGLITGNAKGYVNEIIHCFQLAGYDMQIFDLHAETMGVPQRRERVFFIGRRKDLELPKLTIKVNEPAIPFGSIRTEHGVELQDGIVKDMLSHRIRGDLSLGDISLRIRGINSGYSARLVYDEKVANTNVAGNRMLRFADGKAYSNEDYIHTQTFPEDYDFQKQSAQYVCGMSVPPVMMAHIASAIYEQWLR